MAECGMGQATALPLRAGLKAVIPSLACPPEPRAKAGRGISAQATGLPLS